MVVKTVPRRIILMAMVLGMAVIVGCGGGEGDTTEVVGISQGRWGHTTTLLEDGSMLVVGGQKSLSGKLDTAEIFNPGTESWSSAGIMAEKRGAGHTATRLEDGRVLVIGDSDEALAELYDPSTGEWSSAGVMVEARNWASATLLEDGRVLVVGGLDATKAGVEELDTAEIYDPSIGEWSPTGSMENLNSRHRAVLMEDGKVLVVGQLLTEIYDPSTGTWSSAGKPVRERSAGITAMVLKDGNILVTGGEFQRGGWTGVVSAPLRSTELYDLSTGVWTAAGDMNEPRVHHSAIQFGDGKVLVVANRELEMYNPTTDTWSSAGKMMQERDVMYTATLLGDGRVLIVGGKGDTDEGIRGLTAVEIYDPATFEEAN
jgi:N-acetylneuraminic acid mutarotase